MGRKHLRICHLHNTIIHSTMTHYAQDQRTCDMNGLHLFKRSQRMTFRDEFGDRALMEGAGDQQNNVVNHVRIPG